MEINKKLDKVDYDIYWIYHDFVDNKEGIIFINFSSCFRGLFGWKIISFASIYRLSPLYWLFFECSGKIQAMKCL